MVGSKSSLVLVFLAALVRGCAGQDHCYTSGGVAGIVIATFLVTAVVFGIGLGGLYFFNSKRKGVRPENAANGAPKCTGNGDGKYAYDNPYFRDDESLATLDAAEKGRAGSVTMPSSSSQSAPSSKSNTGSKAKKPWKGMGNPFVAVFAGSKKHRTMDDSCLPMDPERILVPLRGHDFTGLGFNICGNMRDGIFVKDVLHRGPANESGRIKAGDRIVSVTVSFANMVYEDALTILSYASPYDVKLELEKPNEKSYAFHSGNGTGKLSISSRTSGKGQRLFHPLYRSQSIDDLTKIGKDNFPSHGLIPKRSQSIGVATQILKSPYKTPDSLPEEGNRSPTAKAASSTGSLNEKVLTNAMEESFQTRAKVPVSEKPENCVSKKPSGSDSTVVGASRECNEYSEVEFKSSSKSNNKKPLTPAKRKAPAPPVPNNNSIKTTALVHQPDDYENLRVKRKDSSSSSSSNSSSESKNDKNVKIQRCAGITTVTVDNNVENDSLEADSLHKQAIDDDKDSDASSDSLETSKDDDLATKRKASSLGDLTAIEECSKKSPTLLERAVSLDFQKNIMPEENLSQQKKMMKDSGEKIFPGLAESGLDGKRIHVSSSSSSSDSLEQPGSNKTGDTDVPAFQEPVLVEPTAPQETEEHKAQQGDESPEAAEASILDTQESAIPDSTENSVSETPVINISNGQDINFIDSSETSVSENHEDAVVETVEGPNSATTPNSPEKQVISPDFSLEFTNSDSSTPKMSSSSSSSSSSNSDDENESPLTKSENIVTSTPAKKLIVVDSFMKTNFDSDKHDPWPNNNNNNQENNVSPVPPEDGDHPHHHLNKEVIEITKDELDGVMISHKEFLLKQAQVTGVYSDLNPDKTSEEGKDIEFESWHYTEGGESLNGNYLPDNSGSTVDTTATSSYKSALDHTDYTPTVISTDPSKMLISEKTGITLRSPEGSLTTTVIISTSDSSTICIDTPTTADSPPPELQPPPT